MSRVSSPRPPLDVDVIIPIWNSRPWIPACLKALDTQTAKPANIYIVDNGSHDHGAALIEQQAPEVEIIRLSHNTGFAHAVNTGIRAAGSKYTVLLNIDTEPEPEWLYNLVSSLERAPEQTVAMASCMLDYDNPDIIENAGDQLTWAGEALKRGHGQSAVLFQTPVDLLSVCAGAAAYKRDAFDRIGLFDERFFAYLEDVDWGLRASLTGFNCRYEPGARIRHKGHSSELPSGNYIRLMARNRLMLFMKNMPASHLFRHSFSLLSGQLIFMLVYRRQLRAWAKGMAEGLKRLPAIRREHRHVMKPRLTADGIQTVSRLMLIKRERPQTGGG